MRYLDLRKSQAKPSSSSYSMSLCVSGVSWHRHDVRLKWSVGTGMNKGGQRKAVEFITSHKHKLWVHILNILSLSWNYFHSNFSSLTLAWHQIVVLCYWIPSFGSINCITHFFHVHIWVHIILYELFSFLIWNFELKCAVIICSYMVGITRRRKKNKKKKKKAVQCIWIFKNNNNFSMYLNYLHYFYGH